MKSSEFRRNRVRLGNQVCLPVSIQNCRISEYRLYTFVPKYSTKYCVTPPRIMNDFIFTELESEFILKNKKTLKGNPRVGGINKVDRLRYNSNIV